MLDRVFYIRALRGDNQTNLATGIQVVLPDAVDFDEARHMVIARVTEELVRYFASECVSACGVKRD